VSVFWQPISQDRRNALVAWVGNYSVCTAGCEEGEPVCALGVKLRERWKEEFNLDITRAALLRSEEP
jgi:hypothetical protein